MSPGLCSKPTLLQAFISVQVTLGSWDQGPMMVQEVRRAGGRWGQANDNQRCHQEGSPKETMSRWTKPL